MGLNLTLVMVSVGNWEGLLQMILQFQEAAKKAEDGLGHVPTAFSFFEALYTFRQHGTSVRSMAAAAAAFRCNPVLAALLSGEITPAPIPPPCYCVRDAREAAILHAAFERYWTECGAHLFMRTAIRAGLSIHPCDSCAVCCISEQC